MMTLNMMLRQLAGRLTSVRAAGMPYLPIQDVMVVSPGDEAGDGATLYVGAPGDLARVLRGWDGTEPRMVVAAGGTEGLEPLLERDGLFCLTTADGARQTGELLIREMLRFDRWAEEVREGIYRRESLRWIIERIAARIRCPLFWMNAGFRLLGSDVSWSFEDKYIQELLLQGHLDVQSVDELLSVRKTILLGPLRNVNGYETVLDTGHYAVLCEVWGKRGLAGQFLALENRDASDGALADYARELASFFWLYVSLESGESGAATNGLSGGYEELLVDLIERNIKSESELFSRQSTLSPPMTPWYNLILIGFEEDRHGPPHSAAAEALQALIPGAVIVRYDQKLIILDRRRTQARGFEDVDKLQEIMERHHAYACLGSGSEFLASFRSIYLRESLNLRFGMCLREPAERRVFLGDEFHQYQVIDLCARQCGQMYDGNLIYLCSYRFGALYRHDQQHKDDLCRILEVYIQNNCNTSKASKALYLHRNTLINKIAKIEEIIGASLDDVSLRIEMMFSMRVMRYATYYRKEDLFQLKRSWSNGLRTN